MVGRRSGGPAIAVAAAVLGAALLAPGARSAGSGPPHNVSVTPIDHQGYGAPTLARDPRSARRLAIASQVFSGRTCYLALSFDYGKTWRNRAVAGEGTGLRRTRRCSSPTVTYAADGTIYYAFVLPDDAGFSRLYLRVARPGKLLGPARALDSDLSQTQLRAGGSDSEPGLAAGRGGELYVTWKRYDSTLAHGSIQVLRSMNYGARFSVPRTVSAANRTTPWAQPFIARDGAGTLYVNWVDETGVDAATGAGRATIEVARSFDRGMTFASRTIASTPSGCGPDGVCSAGTPRTALVAGTGRHVYTAWSAGPVDGKSRVLVSSSASRGQRWGAPRAVLPQGAGAHQQFRPGLSVAPNGRVDLDFYDLADTGREDVYLASSRNSARSFSAPARLNNAPSDTRAAVPLTDRIGLASANGAAFAAWGDDRRVNLVSVVDGMAGYHTDVYFARKAVP